MTPPALTTREALLLLVPSLSDELVIHTTGFIGRESCAVRDRPEHFYMIGSMGLAPAIGLGLALARPDRRVVVLDGDGALLMALGTLAMVASSHPPNLSHVVLDNGAYASTGYQPTLSRQVALDALAQAAGYRRVAAAGTAEELARLLPGWWREEGPAFLRVRCADGPSVPARRIPHAPPAITARVQEAACR